MSTNVYKQLLTDLDCLADGRFVCPPSMRKYVVVVSVLGEGVSLTVNRAGGKADNWSYSDDFIVHHKGKGGTVYYSWDGVAAVFTIPM